MKKYTEDLQLGRKKIGQRIRIHEDIKIRRNFGFAKITNVVLAPYNTEVRKVIWLNALGDNFNFEYAYDKVIELYGNNLKFADLRQYYITDFESPKNSSFPYLMLEENEFDWII